MTDALDTLRPEVREAVVAIDGGNGVFVNSDDGIGSAKWKVVRAELLRLQSTESRANEWQLRAERAEAELAEARKNETVALGLWNAAEGRATKAEAELAARKARIEGSHLVLADGHGGVMWPVGQAAFDQPKGRRFRLVVEN